jgi:6-phosphofructokinase
MTGPFTDEDAVKFNNSIADFEAKTGIDIQYEGSKEFEATISIRVEAGDAPDIVDFPQPGLLANFVKQETGAKVRGIEFSLLQRCAAHMASKTDVDEAYLAGRMAVKYAVEGKTDYMVAFERAKGDEYKCEIKLVKLDEVANAEKKVPLEWITNDGAGVGEAFIDYALPLIQGESKPPFENGIPVFAKLKKVVAKP